MSAEHAPRHNLKTIAKRAALGTAAFLATSAIIGDIAVDRNPQIGATVMDTFGNIAGNQARLKVEGAAFAARDLKNRGAYWIESSTRKALGKPEEKPEVKSVYTPATPIAEGQANQLFPAQVVEAAPPEPPFNPPEIKSLNGVTTTWTTEGLPNPPDRVVMTETDIYPDPKTHPYSLATVVCIDHRYTDLHMVGGLISPGKEYKISGPGKIPQEDIPSLLLAFNGGWQGEHASWGMYANGKEYKHLLNGYASIVIYKDGTVKIGKWGRDFAQRTDDMTAVRQNSLLLVDDGELTADLKNSIAFGQVADKDTINFITSRSAIGITENGDLLIASGNDMNQVGIASALWAAGAKYAMILDNNLPYVQTAFAFHQADGTVKFSNSRKFMLAEPTRFATKDDYDFMYTTLKSSVDK